MKQGVRSFRALVAVLALFSLLTIPSVMFAQTTTTVAITGIVTDTTGAVVKGATLTLTHASTGSVQTATSDAGGRFVFPVVNPGDYKLKAEAKGFRTNVTNDLVVEVDKSLNAEVKLEVGASSEVVEVTASSMTEVQTQDASVGEVLSGTELNRLPVNGRSAAQLIFLQPGVEPDMGHQNGMNSDDAGGALPIRRCRVMVERPIERPDQRSHPGHRMPDRIHQALRITDREFNQHGQECERSEHSLLELCPSLGRTAPARWRPGGGPAAVS